MVWGQLQEVGKHTLVDQIRLCVRCLRLWTRIRVPRTSVTDVLRKQLLLLSNKLFVVHQRPSAPFGYALGTSKSFPRMNTHGRASSLVEGLEEEVDYGVCGGALTLPFTDFPESLTPTQGATQQSMDCESLTPTQGATQQSVGKRNKKERKKECTTAFAPERIW